LRSSERLSPSSCRVGRASGGAVSNCSAVGAAAAKAGFGSARAAEAGRKGWRLPQAASKKARKRAKRISRAAIAEREAAGHLKKGALAGAVLALYAAAMRSIAILLALLAAGCQRAAKEENAALPDQPGWSGPKEEAGESIPAPKLDRSHAGSAAVADAFEDPDGKPVSLSRFSGKPLLVNFWATWCGPCVAEMPTLDALADRSGERLRVLAVSEDLDGRAKVAAFFAKNHFRTIQPYLDSKMALMPGLKVGTLPTTILYDARGREIWRTVGMEDWRSDRAAKLIGEAFAAKG
jgi:thiol-disulfide isomerase/thioredoxin